MHLVEIPQEPTAVVYAFDWAMMLGWNKAISSAIWVHLQECKCLILYVYVHDSCRMPDTFLFESSILGKACANTRQPRDATVQGLWLLRTAYITTWLWYSNIRRSSQVKSRDLGQWRLKWDHLASRRKLQWWISACLISPCQRWPVEEQGLHMHWEHPQCLRFYPHMVRMTEANRSATHGSFHSLFKRLQSLVVHITCSRHMESCGRHKHSIISQKKPVAVILINLECYRRSSHWKEYEPVYNSAHCTTRQASCDRRYLLLGVSKFVQIVDAVEHCPLVSYGWVLQQ